MYEISNLARYILFMNTSKACNTHPACFKVNYKFSKDSVFCLIYLMLIMYVLHKTVLLLGILKFQVL